MQDIFFPIELSFIIDSKTTEIEVRMQGNITKKAVFIPAGIELVAALVEYLEQNHHIKTNRLYIEEQILQFGSATPVSQEFTINIPGRDLTTGLPRTVDISNQEIQIAISSVIEQIITLLSLNVRNIVPFENEKQLLNQRILLKGEFKNLASFAKLLEEKIGIPISTSN
jgi:rod shape-determining protein MreB